MNSPIGRVVVTVLAVLVGLLLASVIGPAGIVIGVVAAIAFLVSKRRGGQGATSPPR